MKAAVLVAPGRIEIRERPIPEPGPGEVRIKVAAVGVCGSDVHYYREGRIGTQVVQYPTLLGHEPAGVIDAVGADASLAPGTRVAVEPAAPCLHCECCREGRFNICPAVKFLGTPPIDGIFEQYHVVPEHCCIPIPAGLTLREAALLEPLGVGLHSVALARPALGETAAIFGSGPIGLSVLLALKVSGVAAVFMTDRLDYRLELAERLGARAVANPLRVDVREWLLDLTGGRGVDITFEAAGDAQALGHAFSCARRGGRALLVGIPAADELPMPMHECRRAELLVQHVRRSNGEAARCLPLLESGRIDVKPLATHSFPLERTAAALDLAGDYGDGVVRAMVLPNGEMD